MEDKQKTPEYEEYNASLDPDPIPSNMTADELQESLLEDSDMNGFQKFIARLDEKTWTLYQRIVGAILGVAAGISLFWNSNRDTSEQTFSWSLILAVVIAMLIPNILEKQGGRRIYKLRIALVIALGVMIVGYFIIVGATSGFKLTA